MPFEDDDMPQPSCLYSNIDFTIPATNADTFMFFMCPTSVEEVYPDPYSYFYPTFNPNNADEIAYLRRDNTAPNGCNHELWTFSFCTGEANYLTDEVCYSLDWSAKDWIAFTGVDRQVWKVKISGDSLTQLTNSGSFNNYPIWDHQGKKIAFKKKIGNEGYFILIDESGNSLDTIFELKQPSFFAWSSNNKFSCTATISNQRKLAFYNTGSGIMNYLHDLSDSTTHDLVQATAWSDNNESILWVGWSSLNKTNITTGERTTIWAPEFTTRRFNALDVSPDGNTFILQQDDLFEVSECEMGVRNNLYLVDIDGTNERKIVFPE